MDTERWETLRSQKLGTLQAAFDMTLRVFDQVQSGSEADMYIAEGTMQFIRQLELEISRLDAEMDKCIGISK